MVVNQAYIYEFAECENGQFELCAQHAGLSKFSKNWVLRLWKKEREAFVRVREHVKLTGLSDSTPEGRSEIEKIAAEAALEHWTSVIDPGWTDAAKDFIMEVARERPFVIAADLEKRAKMEKEAAKKAAAAAAKRKRGKKNGTPPAEEKPPKPKAPILVEHRRTSYGDMSKIWTRTQRDLCVGKDGQNWAEPLTRWAAEGALQDTDGAYFNHFKQRKKAMTGQLPWNLVPGLPTFKKRGGRKSFAVQVKAVKLPMHDAELKPDQVRVSGIGVIRLKESLQKFQGTIKEIAISSKTRGRWWISFAVERTRPIPRRKPVPRVGIDLGARDTITLSDGNGHERSWQAPKPLANALKRLRRHNKALSRRQKPVWDKETNLTATPGSSGWYKKRIEISKLHFKIAEKRRVWLHNVTTEIAKTYTDIVIEGYNARELVKKSRKVVKTRGGRRDMADSAVGMARHQLKYKGEWYGCRVQIADPKLPTNKTCHVCGWVSTRTQSKRIYKCDACGQQCIRPINTARFLVGLRSDEEWTAMDAGPLGGEDQAAPSAQQADGSATPPL